MGAMLVQRRRETADKPLSGCWREPATALVIGAVTTKGLEASPQCCVSTEQGQGVCGFDLPPKRALSPAQGTPVGYCMSLPTVSA